MIDRTRNLARPVALVLLAWAVFAGRPAIFRARQRIGQWAIEYSTKAVNVVKVEDLNAYQVSVTVRNVSGRPISSLGLYIGTEAKYHEPVALKSEATETVVIGKPQTRRNWVIRVAAVLFGDGPAAADGDPEDIEYMRFERLGEAIESARCVSIFSALDPAHLDDNRVNAAIASVSRQPVWPLEKALAGFPDSPLKAKLQGASDGAKEAFIGGVDMYWGRCQNSLQRLRQPPNGSPGSVESDRIRYLSEALPQHQATANEYQTLSDVDMGVAIGSRY